MIKLFCVVHCLAVWTVRSFFVFESRKKTVETVFMESIVKRRNRKLACVSWATMLEKLVVSLWSTSSHLCLHTLQRDCRGSSIKCSWGERDRKQPGPGLEIGCESEWHLCPDTQRWPGVEGQWEPGLMSSFSQSGSGRLSCNGWRLTHPCLSSTNFNQQNYFSVVMSYKVFKIVLWGYLFFFILF